MQHRLTLRLSRPLAAIALASVGVTALAPAALYAGPAHAAKKAGPRTATKAKAAAKPAKAPANRPSHETSRETAVRAYAPVAISGPSAAMAVALGRGQLVSLPSAMKDVFVADDKIADVQVKSNNQLYVYGRSAGETTIYASNAAGQVIWSTNVRVASNIDSVDQMLRVAMPESHINVATLSAGTYLLTGTVAAPDDAAEAQRLVTAYLGKEANVITRLKTATPLQVNLQVRIAEVSRSLAKQIGVNLTSIANAGNGFQFGISQGRSAASTYVPGSPMGVGGKTTYTDSTGATQNGTSIAALSTATTLAGAGTLFGLNILGTLDAGEQIGLVTTLAQPNLTAISGETGEFLAGGEFPIPISSGLGTVSIEYKKYGVSLSFTPTVLSDGRISMRVRPEVSELSSQGAVTLNGYSIPALSTRRTETSVELGSGQSMMIGGLLQNKASNTIQKMPGAGDLPILGALFKSTSFIKGETELVIVITPYLVKPVNDGDIKLPTDGMQTANDIQQVAAHMLSDGKSGVDRAKPSLKPAETDGTAPKKVGAAQEQRNDPPKAGARAVATEAAQPGFSLN
ncbi:type II and III secretion system protein family protein [Novosphingobium humi]|uniref:type II and III secretion system protein family protein n=1 Tax=Novosphingobium humi TaxID=2282397 RepID=UPI0025AF97BB|nr:type II and III secretion system protein family protein [Novosphingobium humi]WJS98453.1 type II and III secretion system protein family protein [Novosphingobium humi]